MGYSVFKRALTTMLCVAAPSFAMAETGSRPQPQQYVMGPQDKLKVRVYDWRIGTYDTHEWPALTGEFTVGASGSVSFPIVGEVPADGKTPGEVATLISERLRDKVGLAQTPYASVEIIQYRPFYVLGDIAKPGEYPYRPSLTVLQALGVAGGLERSSETNFVGLEREALSGDGEIRVLEAERRHALVRQARIEAELAGRTSPTWPAEIADQSNEPSMAQAMREEEALLKNHLDTTRVQSESVRQNHVLLSGELDSLKSKKSILQYQEKLSQSELTLVSSLVARGLAGTPRQLALQQNQAQLESSRVDLEVTTLRTQQDAVRIDRDQVDLEAKNKSQLLVEEAEIRSRLASTTERIVSLRRLVDHASAKLPALYARLDRRKLITGYLLGRLVDGEISYTEVSESFILQPGDTLRVEQRRGEPSALVSSSQ